MSTDVKNLEEKIRVLEENIKEFEENHNKQLNNLIGLFSDVIEIIKNRELKELEENKKDLNYLNELDFLNDFNTYEPINVEDNDFYGKTPKEIADYIINKVKEETKEEKIEVVEKLDNPIKYNLEDLKMEITPIEIVSKNNNMYKIEKAFEPVQIWIDTFKNTKKYQDIVEKLNSYGIIGEINNVVVNDNRVRLGALVKLKSNSKVYTSPNLNIDLGTIEEKGYDNDSTFMVMSINYVDDMTDERTTFDLYNLKTNEDRNTLIDAESKFLNDNQNAKIKNYCVSAKNGQKIGWTTLENLNKIVIDEMELV